jgi:hypothetical protein
MRSSKGQNLIEYIMLVTAVLIVGIYFYTTGPMQQAVNSSLYGIVNQINKSTQKSSFNEKGRAVFTPPEFGSPLFALGLQIHQRKL